MPEIKLLTPAQELDEQLRTILRQLKQRLRSSSQSRRENEADIRQDQIDRARDVIFGGVDKWPAYPTLDPDWIDRYNQAIEDGDQELAAKIIVGKEDQINLTWNPSINPTIIKYKIYYTGSINSPAYNGSGLGLDLSKPDQVSPIEVPVDELASPKAPNARLYGSQHGIPYKFAISEVMEDGTESGLTEIFKSVSFLWEKPYGKTIKRYELHYKTSKSNDEYNGNNLRESIFSIPIVSPIVITSDDIIYAGMPSIKFVTNNINVSFYVRLVAVTNEEEAIVIDNVYITNDALPCKNEYCEIELSSDDDAFSMRDRILALLWYVNYVFFLRSENFWCAARMLEERRQKKTIFPTTTPWYFTPTLKGAWEIQEYTDDNQYIYYVEQKLLIPILAMAMDRKNVIGANVKIHNNYVNDIVRIDISDSDGLVDITLTAGTITETYNDIRTGNDLARAMLASAVGVVELDPLNSNLPLVAVGTETHQQSILQFSRPQVDTFTMAYYGDFIAKPFGFVLNFSPERRIITEGWEEDFDAWKNIHKELRLFLEDLVALNPLYYINDVASAMAKRLRKEVLDIPELVRTGMMPENGMDRIVSIVGEDDGLTSEFSSYMVDVMNYITDYQVNPKDDTSQKTDVDAVFAHREDVLLARQNPDLMQGMRLPYKWDLLKLAFFKFSNADYWTRIADLNGIANPLDTVEVFDGRKIVLPSMPNDRVRNPNQG